MSEERPEWVIDENDAREQGRIVGFGVAGRHYGPPPVTFRVSWLQAHFPRIAAVWYEVRGRVVNAYHALRGRDDRI